MSHNVQNATLHKGADEPADNIGHNRGAGINKERWTVAEGGGGQGATLFFSRLI